MSGARLGARTRAAPRRRRRVANDWGRGAMSGPPLGARTRAAPRLRRGVANDWGLGGHVGAPARRAYQSRATASPGRGERLGAWGPCRGPHLNQTSPPRSIFSWHVTHVFASGIALRRAGAIDLPHSTQV